MTIGTRLKEERKRLGISQEAFAGIAGASRRSQVKWEGDITSPNADALADFSTEGADILYIVTGCRSASHCSPAATGADGLNNAAIGIAELLAQLPRDERRKLLLALLTMELGI